MDYTTSGFEDMELSTQLVIGEALKRGATVEMLDRADNFILIRKGNRSEAVKQATRTQSDTYMAALAMENKIVTKALLRRADIHTPEGTDYGKLELAIADRPRWAGRKIVVKPVSTNFGQGVSILSSSHTEQEWNDAVHLAFSFDHRIISEEFAPGIEHRFLVIGGKTVAVLRRDPAHVIGDGESTVFELIVKKNGHPYRGVDYHSPLERIVLGEEEMALLREQGLKPGSVAPKGEMVFLRRNSNISTGGDSVDCTDAVAEGYKRIAEKAALAVGAKITGADIVIEGSIGVYDPKAYTVLELNFNPALHIHAFPASGMGRRVERELLDLIGIL